MSKLARTSTDFWMLLEVFRRGANDEEALRLGTIEETDVVLFCATMHVEVILPLTAHWRYIVLVRRRLSKI